MDKSTKTTTSPTGRGLSSRETRSDTIGIIGAGTMGSGIALVALSAWRPVVLVDPLPEALAAAESYLRKHLSKPGKHAALDLVRFSGDLEDLAGCGVVIEAAPEDVSTKRNLFSELDRICPPPALLATNTSTLSVTAIAAATSTAERVAGLHFFNPAPLMSLVEVARGAQTADSTLRELVSLVESLGKTPVVASDTPGFIVNRVARPFYGEALRLVAEGVATFEQVDRIVEQGGGFRMGPFRLMDLIGLDVNLAATRSIYEQTFGEPRFRPHPLQVRMVEQGRLGRKTGIGFYDYSHGETRPPAEAEPPGRAEGLVVVSEGSWGPGVAEALLQAGHTLHEAHGSVPTAAVILAGREEGARENLRRLDRALPLSVPLLVQLADVTLGELLMTAHNPQRIVGFDGLFFAEGTLVTLVGSPKTDPAARQAVDEWLTGLGRRTEWIEDSPGLVLPRIVCALANEAAFALAEGVADEPTIDLAMRLGASYPHGPLEWARRIGLAKVSRVMDHLRAELGEDRYRTAPWLRRWARQGE
ncbi:MAG TPA: 3-hydroxyacyl-CoA dehydrogenase NAD-binding domain-containing protein [Anaerolineales bacterium]|nr:3-hydroxyacyl-CoA dehydrogenase NAD-binding domain-containing protein [Anaerolineales bacterium]